MQVGIEVLDQRSGGIDPDRGTVSPDQALDRCESGFIPALQRVDQTHHRNRSLALACEIHVLFHEGALRQRRNVTAGNKDRDVGCRRLYGRTGFAGPDHGLGGGGRLMSEYDHADKHRIQVSDAIGDDIRLQVLRIRIDDRDRIAPIPGVAGDQSTPQRSFNRRQVIAQLLIDLTPATGIDKD